LYRISNLENSAEEFTQNAAHRNKMKKPMKIQERKMEESSRLQNASI
jgi:hypothetical protein